MEREFILGDKVRDTVTGYEGIATVESMHLNGCTQIEITPRLKKGEGIKVEDIGGMAFDIQQVEKIGNGINKPKTKVKKTYTGGPSRYVTMKKPKRSVY